MITEYQVRNFKCFADTGPVRLGAITVLLGRNNSGKSSLIQPLQMLAQTLAVDDPSVQLATHEPRDFGGYFEWVHRGETKRDFGCSFTFGPVDLARTALTSTKVVRKPTLVSVDLTFGVVSKNAVRDRLHLKAITLKASLARKAERVTTNKMEWSIRLDHRRKPMAATFNGKKIDARGLELINCFPDTLKWDRPASIFVSDYAVIQPPHYFYSMYMPIQEALNIACIEPMRPAIPRVLRSNDRSPRRGGSTTDILAGLFRARTRRPKEWAEFQDYVSRWFGTVAECFTDFDIEVVDEQRELFALVGNDVKTGARVNLADMGFGIAQAFPIFVRLFYSREGQIVVIEEPELHLNPAAQGMIFDAVAERATQGRQIVVETHSEHFVLRMRRQSLAQPELRSIIRVYYIERQADQSSLTELPLTEDGRLDNWPAGFLDEAFAESMAILQTAEKRQGRK